MRAKRVRIGGSVLSAPGILFPEEVVMSCLVGSIQVVLGDSPVVEAFDAVIVVLFASGKVVLVKNARRAWEFPGGHREDDESYQETAAREALEEASATIRDIEYLGHYTAPTGHVTVITRAAVASFLQSGDDHGPSNVRLFDELPDNLSFGDGREQLFLEYARERDRAR